MYIYIYIFFFIYVCITTCVTFVLKILSSEFSIFVFYQNIE